MSSAIDTTVDFRRKLLRFDRPLYHQYRKSNIPRFYSNFTPSFRTYYKGPSECNSTPEHYPINFPITNIDLNNERCIDYSKYTIVPNLFDLKSITMLMLLVLLLLSIGLRSITLFVALVIVYYYFPSIEMFGTRPVLQRGIHFYYPSYHR